MTNSKKLVVLMIDGFSNFYLDNLAADQIPNIRKIISNGVRAERLTPEFPSFTLPNFMAMCSGLHVEHHGVFTNVLYDQKTKQILNMEEAKYRGDFFFSDMPEPIWIEAQKQGVQTSLYWPWFLDPENKRLRGNHVHFEALSTFHSYPQPQVAEEIEKRYNQIVAQLQQSGPQLAMVYYPSVDLVCHGYGPWADEALQEVQFVDRVVVGLLLKKLNEANLQDSVNILIMSDHGHVAVQEKDLIIVEDHVSLEHIETTAERGPVVIAYPKLGEEKLAIDDFMKADIPHVKVYTKENMPDRLKCKNAKFLPPIILVADLPYTVGVNDVKKRLSFVDNHFYDGVHGYDNAYKEMEAICIAQGPGLIQGAVTPALTMPDLYLLMCRLLGIQPRQGIDAIDEGVDAMLKN